MTILYLKIIALMPIFDRKRPFSKKDNALMHIFGHKTSFLTKHESFVSNFAWKTPCCHTHIWSKNINSANTTLLYGPKKSIRWSFIRYFTKKSMLACPYFIKNTYILSKNTLLSSPYNVKITSILWKTLFSHFIFL